MSQNDLMRTALNGLPKCPRCGERVDNINVFDTVKFCDLVSIVQIRSSDGEYIARMMIEAIGKVE